jgi:hypothetical protein
MQGLKIQGSNTKTLFWHAFKGTWQRGGFSGVFAEIGSA